jgi:hypothetical protein
MIAGAPKRKRPTDGRHRIRMINYFGAENWDEEQRDRMRQAEARAYIAEELERLARSDRLKASNDPILDWD